ncbi:elongation factor P hydroxylase [Alteromonas sp. 5E99-2]|uniref:elongation factor P hydroxylase n=1 Tax=Alteromonas sp. 5E99-2 TaxID=2817683 RepID=UPI001A98DDB6|nr:elongation factor P hydroxylase [Alteromonas sp. 5E99-2]MBO1255127.1 elongation factor P hydroxylase [Alteromonas sp. 5E99-2]
MKENEKVRKLIELFDVTFQHYNTRLILGDDEPLYAPQDQHIPYHRIIFAHGFFSSALHEIAHWCLAGEKRRLQTDYGYWYEPDGRNEKQQAEFELVEVKPQAIEWGFSLASNHKFRVSTDNLNGAQPNTEAFAKAVETQLGVYMENGFPPRAQVFIHALQKTFNVSSMCGSLA